MCAAAEGRELVQILLAAGADPTAQDAQHGRTALHTAAMANNVELVRVRCFPTENILKFMFQRGRVVLDFVSVDRYVADHSQPQFLDRSPYQ